MSVRSLAFLVAALAPAALAQPARTIPVGDPAYDAIERLQRRGHLLGLHPTALPYTEAEVAEALAAVDSAAVRGVAAEWVGLLRGRLGAAVPEAGRLALRADIGAGVAASTSARLDALRPAAGDPTLGVGDGAVYPEADATVALGAGGLVAQLGLRLSVYANDDPDGLDVAKRLMVRNEEGYVAYRSALADVALGRVGTHWGRAGRDAVFLSDNPRPFDALHLRLGGDRIAVRGVLGQLDAVREDGTFTDVDGQRPGDRWNGQSGIDRFFAAHRFDWRPSRNVVVTVSESAVYSGPNAGLHLGYLLPTQAFTFLIDNTPKDVENNGAVGGSLWAYARGWTVHGELFLDDFDILDWQEPSSFAITGTVTRAGVLPRLDAEVGLTAVAARTYNTGQREGVYLYALRGLAQEFSDFVRLHGRADWYAAPGLTLSPTVDALWQGAFSIEAPFPANDEVGTILTGDVARTLRLGVEAQVLTDPRWWLSADVGYNVASEAVAEGVHAVVHLGARVGTAGAVRAGL